MNTSLPPYKASAPLQITLVLLTAVLLAFSVLDSLWNASSDLAHHYALALRLTEFWTLPPHVDPTLGEMNIYPRGAHTLAALIGNMSGSALVGLHLISVMAMLAIWAAFIWMLLSLPRKAAFSSLALLAIAVGCNGLLTKFVNAQINLHGGEIIGNFFYSQLVAQALMAITVLIMLFMERHLVPLLVRVGFILMMVYFTATMHLLPAAQMVAMTLTLLAFESAMQLKQGRREFLKSAILNLLLMGLAVFVLIKHPSFASMSEISRNNGDLHIAVFNTKPKIAIWAFLLLALSCFNLWHWHKLQPTEAARQLLALKYLGLAGIAISGMCLAQIVMLWLGGGSEYAVKKHMFAVNTIFLLQICVLPYLLLVLRKQTQQQVAQASGPDTFYHYLALPLLLVFVFYQIKPAHKTLDTSDIVGWEKELQIQRTTLGLFKQPGKYVYLASSPVIPNTVSYMLTIGVLKVPRTENSLLLFGNQDLAEWHRVGAILAPPKSRYSKFTECQRSYPSMLIPVLDGQCVAKALGQEKRLIALSSMDAEPPCKMSGVAEPEIEGRWTMAKRAILECELPAVDGKPAKELVLKASAFLYGKSLLKTSISLNGAPAQLVDFTPQNPLREIVLPLPENSKKFVLQIDTPDVASPKQLGLNDDPRELGLSLKWLEIR